MLVSQMRGPFTVLDYGGGPAVQLAYILRYARGLDPSQMTYVLVETTPIILAEQLGGMGSPASAHGYFFASSPAI
jgi:hypothetical protein